MTFSVGTAETHTVVFRFNPFWGDLSITVDGQPVVRTLRLFSLRLLATWTFTVGAEERHTVRIEKRRPLLSAGFRPQTVQAFVEDQLVAEDRTDP